VPISPEKRLKIVQLAAPVEAGGAERVIEALAVGHHRRGHDVTVGTLLLDRGDEHPFVKRLRSFGVRVHPIRVRSRGYRRERQEVSALCRDLRPDVVHFHGYRLEIVDRPVVTRLGIPTVTTMHGFNNSQGGLKDRLIVWLQRRNYRRFDAIIPVSRSLFDQVSAEGLGSDKAHLIPNAWSGFQEPLPRAEARRELGLDEDASVIGWVGRLFAVKGGDVFLRALSHLPRPRPVAAMVGYGPEADRLTGLAKDLGLTDDVRFYPHIRNAGRYFRAFDTFVLSSRFEGLPIVLFEAMAARTPIVATRVGGIPDAVGEGEAWLVPPEQPSALATAISDSLQDRASAATRVENASNRLENEFSLETFLDRHERVYERLVRPRR